MTVPALAEQVHYSDASGALSSVWLLVAIPLASAAVLLLLGRRADRWGHLLGCASIGASFVLGLWYFFTLHGLGHKAV
jgi:NADH-quinone oxidoreductase subunit L